MIFDAKMEIANRIFSFDADYHENGLEMLTILCNFINHVEQSCAQLSRSMLNTGNAAAATCFRTDGSPDKSL